MKKNKRHFGLWTYKNLHVLIWWIKYIDVVVSTQRTVSLASMKPASTSPSIVHALTTSASSIKSFSNNIHNSTTSKAPGAVSTTKAVLLLEAARSLVLDLRRWGKCVWLRGLASCFSLRVFGDFSPWECNALEYSRDFWIWWERDACKVPHSACDLR